MHGDSHDGAGDAPAPAPPPAPTEDGADADDAAAAVTVVDAVDTLLLLLAPPRAFNTASRLGRRLGFMSIICRINSIMSASGVGSLEYRLKLPWRR